MSFTQIQTTGSVLGSGGSVSFQPASPTTMDNLLVAVLVTSSSTSFTPPAGGTNTGWQLGLGVPYAGGRVEIWYWSTNPGGLYPAATPAVFSAPGTIKGTFVEYASPTGTQQVLQTTGNNSGTGYGSAIPMASAGGVFAGTLGIIATADSYASALGTGVSAGPVNASGFTTVAQSVSNVALAYVMSQNLNLAAGYQSGTAKFTYGGPVTSNGWAGAMCCFRAVTVNPINWNGGEVSNTLDIDPTSQMIILGGDVEGFFTTANMGDNWQPANYGIENKNQQCFAFVTWSKMGGTEAGNIYAGGGHAAGDGAFLLSTDGGCTWTQRSTSTVWWYGNSTPSPPRPTAHDSAKDRAVGDMLAQDPTGGFLYSATGNMGVGRSGDFGVTWASISAAIGTPSNFYPRCIAINPANNQELWVGAWDTGNGLGGVWHTTNAQAASPTWNQLAISPGTGTVSDLKVLGDYVYATCDTAGIYRAQISTGGNFSSLNGSFVDTSGTSFWTGLDGYIDGSGNHVVIAGCSYGILTSGNLNYTQVVSLLLPGASSTGITYTDLTNFTPGTQTVTSATFPPFSTAWWKAGSTWQNWLGGSQCGNIHVRIDPNNTSHIFLSGAGGFFRSLDGGHTWQMPINGLPMSLIHTVAIDPGNPSHFVTGGGDYTGMDFLDPTGETQITANNPPGSGFESHAVSFDPVNSLVYAGQNNKFALDSGGVVYNRQPAGSSAWSAEMGYAAAAVGNGHAPMGMLAGRDAANHPFLVVLANTVGMVRWSNPGTAAWAKCTENDTAPLPGTGGTLALRSPFVPIISGHSASHLYCWDDPNGLYRSVDYGASWTQVWTQTNGNQLAFNPSVSGELWAAGTSNLYKISGADTGVVGQTGGPTVTAQGGVFSAGCGGVAFATNGALFATAMGGTAPAPPVTTLYVSYNDGATWTPACAPPGSATSDGSDASYGAPAGPLYISSSGWIWSPAGTHVGWWNQIEASSPTAPLSGQGTLTAVSSGNHGVAALSGQGNLTANPTVAQTAILSGHGTLTAVGTSGGAFAGVAHLNGVGTLTAISGIITASTIIPPYLPEQPLLTSDINDWFTWDIAYKTFSLGRPSTTTLTPDPDLSLAIEAGASYEVRTVIFYDGPNGANMAFNFGYPTDAAMNISWWYPDSSGNLSGHASAGSAAHQANTAPGSTTETILGYGNLQAGLTAGSLSFQWAQNSSNGTAVVAQAYSMLMMRRIQ